MASFVALSFEICWDLFDFLDKKAGDALAQQVIRMVRPGGAVMGLFCTSATFTL